MDYSISFTDKEITPWAGLGFLRSMMDKLGFSEKISSMGFIPQPNSNRGYSPETIIEAFMVSVWCGANRFLHTEITRHDKALSNIFGWDRVPGNDTYKRFFRKFDLETSSKYSDELFKWTFDNIVFDRYTLDCDSTILTRYGKQQEGAEKGYNPKKPGRDSHHPLLAFVNDLKLVANLWLRPGNTSSANNFAAFLDDTINKLQNKKIALVRLDSGFYSKDVLDLLEKKNLNYITSVRFYRPIQKMISLEQAWFPIENGIEICDTEYQAENWEKPRRIVVVRQKVKERPNAVGKHLSLFEGTQFYYRYRYTAYVTNLESSSIDVWRSYRQRGDSENRIKEIKEDFGFDSFNLKDFYATEAALTTAVMGYNLMAMFRMFVLNSKVQHKLSTLRYKTFAIGAFFQKTKGRYILKIALARQRRKWFLGLWNESNSVQSPFIFSNA